MTNNPSQPRNYDAVLGGQGPAPLGAMVLGGLEGVKLRLGRGDPAGHPYTVEQRIAALAEALKYGPDGLDLIIESLHDKSWKIQEAAYSMLERRTEPRVIHALRSHNPDNNSPNNNRYETFVGMGRSGQISNIDVLMQNLENDQNLSTSKLVDYSLGLVETQQGENRIKDYLFNGTQMQRNYAALYFKRRGKKDVLDEAVRKGCIDKLQAFSK